ncbi:hypothetical protein KY320_02550 [Candidatus Woesearchaeota archaeon]|nr:hypothetical protein [Candidatus Woesearchaeota archaeon]
MTITNEQIMEKLLQLEKQLSKLLAEEDQILKEEEEIEKDSRKVELEEEKLLEILSSQINKRFDNIVDWKRFIWDECELRKSVLKDKQIDFYCKKTGSFCRFIVRTKTTAQ